MIHKIKSLFLRSNSHQMDDNTIKPKEYYYKLSDTCQIPNLAHLYEKHLGKITNGIFVEVGAFDGEYVSNTSGLADIGWTGFYYEPIKDFYEKCKARHQKNKNVKVLNIAIGSENKDIEINISGPLSSIDKGVVENFKKLDWAKNIITNSFEKTKQITLNEALLDENVNNTFDLLVIDVEGYEWEVLKNFDLQKWSPKMVIIELHDQNPDYPQLEERCNNIVALFEKNNYRIIYKDFTNTVYVKK